MSDVPTVLELADEKYDELIAQDVEPAAANREAMAWAQDEHARLVEQREREVEAHRPSSQQ